MSKVFTRLPVSLGIYQRFVVALIRSGPAGSLVPCARCSVCSSGVVLVSAVTAGRTRVGSPGETVKLLLHRALDACVT